MTSPNEIVHELSRKCIGPASEPKVVVTREFLQQVLAHIQKPHVCPNCGEVPTFGLDAWLLEPSRDKPLAAAAAVNISRGRSVL